MLSPDPIQVGVFFWENPIFFLALLAGVFLVVLARFVWVYRQDNRSLARALAVSGLALLGLGISTARVLGPVALETFAFADSRNLPALDRAAQVHARRVGRPILYYFRADWCTHCPDFERYRLRSPLVSEALARFVVVRMDLTDFDRWKKYASDEFGVHGTPSLVLRDRKGRLRPPVIEGDDLTATQLNSWLRGVAGP